MSTFERVRTIEFGDPSSGPLHIYKRFELVRGERVESAESLFEKQKHLREEQGREAWIYLHTTDDDPETAIVKFEAMIPSYGCTCKSDYAKIKEQHPFDCSSPDAFFVFGVSLHNAVNRKLNKPELPLDEARRIWNRPEPME